MRDAVVFGTLNLNFGRSSRAHASDIARAFNVRDVDVLAVQENRAPGRSVAPRDARVAVGAQPEGYSSQAVIMSPRRSALEVRGIGSRRAFGSRFGQAIDWRRHVWALIFAPVLGGPTVVISVHVPPRYMWRTPIEKLTAASLRRVIRRHRRKGRQVVVMGDFNYVTRKHGDRLGLGRCGLRQVAGSRIDQIWVSDGIEADATREVSQRRYGRTDDHPLVVADLRGAGTYSAQMEDR